MNPRLFFGIGFFTLALSAGTALAGSIEGPLQVIVSKDTQSLVVYDGDTVIATSKVSTGKKGHSTPTGIFSILEKKRYHESNIYSGAPMPFMQRLTWSGIALHASNSVPDYPASHGCVRLPNKFAPLLYSMTNRGAHVVISDRQLVPEQISHRVLMQPETEAKTPLLLSDAQLRPAMEHAGTGSVEVAMNETTSSTVAEPAEEKLPIRILISRRGEREMNVDVQTLLTGLGFDAGVPDGFPGRQTRQAISDFQTAEKLTVDGKITPDLVTALYAKAGKGTPANGIIMVRQKFKPVFEAPISIKDPEIALGTHFFQFQDTDTKTGKGEWFGLTMDNDLPKSTMARLGITKTEDALAFNAAHRTLDRITIPEETRKRIALLLADGSSLSVSDTGLGQDTGDGTDFITITRRSPKG
ncbi:L,D-transpeptidase family protein [Pararhizobium sp.]|uniref:L,D-transpeptidase family protein n=1 Tax=Pararhizobium sp. TaxID=1977563 RepID=UPI0027265FD1|nr:L,D-transpeptidase family protein [Pararhizobium sp.]MDO9415906.1 L,D-transpeptidase family protein [Pararhizobium sp.]